MVLLNIKDKEEASLQLLASKNILIVIYLISLIYTNVGYCGEHNMMWRGKQQRVRSRDYTKENTNI